MDPKVPKWQMTLNRRLSLIPKRDSKIMRWPLEETGKNSVNPWTMPKSSASQ